MSVPTHQQDLIALLEERGFVHQCTDRDGLAAHLAAGPATAYLGFDATADSLHVGHLQGLMLMRWLQKAGHRPLLLIGGATTRIGDPSFRDSSRPILTEAQIQANIDGIARVFSRYVELHDDSLVNNAEWLDGVGYLEFLDRVGRHFSINRLLTFDAIRQRLDREHSLSFLEFGYTCCRPTISSNCRAGAAAPCNSAAPTSGRTSSTAWSCRDARAAPSCSA